MFDKLKTWLIGSVIMKKVMGKVAKHATTAITGFVTGGWFAANVLPVLSQLGISINYETMSTGTEVLFIGLMGGLWNYIEHRFIKK